MPHKIKNNKIEVLIDLPHENYAGARFDWSGKISVVKFKGDLVSGTEVLGKNNAIDSGKGFYNEFGIDTPLGYDEIKKGDWFHKIGVGLLQKNEDEYAFSKAYPIKACDFEIKTDLNKIQFECQAPLVNDYSYHFKKEIEVVKNAFTINYYLKNTGEKDIITDEYNHNFLALGNDVIGENYQLRFPFQLLPQHFDEYLDTEQILDIAKHELKFAHTPKEAFFISNLSGGKTVAANWELINLRHQIGIRETGDYSTQKINLWGCGHVVSPELFFKISLKPRESCSWSRIYELFELS